MNLSSFKLPYGTSNKIIRIPDSAKPFLLPDKKTRTVSDPKELLVKSLREPVASLPLAELENQAETIGIIVNDITRPTPTAFILPVVLNEIARDHWERITIFIATGSHRACTPEEIRQILGEEIANNFKIVQNDALADGQFAKIGESRFGNELLVNTQLLACDLIISIGFIEPHFFAGFSGGLKNVVPGMAAMRTIMGDHSASMIDDPKATWGVSDGNPIWEEINSVGLLFPQLFLINVTLNDKKEIDNIFCGDADQTYRAGCEYVRKTAMMPVQQAFDVVVTTNSGFPLDINLYQTVKGMSAAAQIVKPGGTIIIFSECRDGIPEHGCYQELLESAATADELLENIYELKKPTPDQWQAQIQAKIQKKAAVFLYTENLSDAQVRACLLEPFHDFDALLAQIFIGTGRDPSICVMPQGPLTVPYISGR